VQYTSKLDPSLSQITGDKTKLQEVFRNLLKNAYEASLPDKSLYLEAFQSEEFVTISIHDTGCGIASERLEEIFQPFVTDKPTGTGLGLPICKQIVTAHQGTITVESSPNLGTTFHICLPVNLHTL
jgi:signal transduction histidine kinase